VKSKNSVAKKPHKPWLGDLVLAPKPASAWFNDILIACKRLPHCLEGVSFARFSASRPHQDAAMRHIQQIGEAASRQPTRVRLRHPAVDWSALVRLKKMIGLRGSPTMTPRQIWDFVLEIPRLEKWLRETWTKAEREAAEARADARDARIAERRIAKLEAGRVRAISSAEMREQLGLGPRGDKPQTPDSHRYHFVFWLEDGIWSAKAPSVRGVYGVGPTAASAKDDLVEALEALSEYLRKSGENGKAAVCDRLVASWKTKTRRRKTSSRRS
jgi:uncharacterized protein with HEPN domain/predicted RNase H-like HicB family nuclease